jgi:quinone-modifying oxidoreductase subunit QmoC
MTVRVDPSFMGELERFGAFDIRGCFNCGNCTAVCSLSQGGENFPRRLIRYAQLGMRDQLAASKEVWLCYYCGDCSESCPRQAEPGEFMASARRYFISSWDLTSVARRLYTSWWFTALFMGILAVLFAGMLLASGGKMTSSRLELFGFIPLAWIHNLGTVVLILAGLAAAANVVNAARRMNLSLPAQSPDKRSSLKDAWGAARKTLKELAAQTRFAECAAEGPGKELWYLSARWIHLAIMWGFLGLFAATALDFLFKVPGSSVPLWYPARLLGTVAGLALLYGTTVALVRRLTPGAGSSFAHSLLSDWLLLWLLWSVALTGFLLEIAVYQPAGAAWGYAAFLVHVVLALELVILLPFTKFAHMLYRPLALWILNLRSMREQENPDGQS